MAFSKARRLGELVTTAGVLDQVTVATASSGDNDTSPASTAFVTGAISDLSDSAPGTLNTLNELAAALGDDANFSTTVTNSIATKLPLAGGTLTGNLAHASDFTLDVGGDITLDAGGENIRFDLNGNEVGQIDLGSANMTFRTSQNGDIIFRGTPSGATEIAMLTLDTSASGDATFSNDVYLANGKFLRWGDGSVRIYGDSTDGTELITFVTGGTERMRISDNGFLKLSSKVSFSGTGDAGLGHHTNNYLYMYGGTAGLILQDNSGGSQRMLLRDSGTIEFAINAAEAARIDNNGTLCINTTVTSNSTSTYHDFLRIGTTFGHNQAGSWNVNGYDDFGTLYCDTGGTGVFGKLGQNAAVLGSGMYNYTSASGKPIYFYVDGSYRCMISSSSSGTLGSSDIKWKENVEDINYGLDTVKSLQPRKFKWKNTGKESIGFIAQEMETIISEVVEDAPGDGAEGQENPGKSLDYAALTSVLTKAIQELSAKLDAAEARIETLEG